MMTAKITTAMCLMFLLQACVDDPKEPLKAHLKRELPSYGYADLDLDALSHTQLVRIDNLIHSGKNASKIRGGIGVIVDGSILGKIFG